MPGLFSTPDEVAQAQQALQESTAHNFGALSQEGAGPYLGMRAGQQIGGLLSGPNPAMVRSMLVQDALKEVNHGGLEIGTPKYFDALTKALNKRNMTNDALSVQDYAETLRGKRAKSFQEEAAGLKALRGIGDLDPSKFEAPSVEKFNKTGRYGDLEPLDKSTPEWRKYQELKRSMPDDEAKAIAYTLYEYKVDPVTGSVTASYKGNPRMSGPTDTAALPSAPGVQPLPGAIAVTPGNKPETEVDVAGRKNLLLHDKETLDSLLKDATAAARGNYTLQKILDRYKSGVTTGTFADQRVVLQRFLNTIGVQVDTNNLANSGALAPIASSLVLDMVKQLGSGVSISNADRQFAEEMAPRLAQDPGTFVEVVKYIKDRNNNALSRYQGARKHAEKHKGSLAGYEGDLFTTSESGVTVPQDQRGTPAVVTGTLQERIDEARKRGLVR